MAVKWRNIGQVVITMAKLLIKKDQALVVRTKLERMFANATNMAAELQADKLWNATDQQIRQILTINEGICEVFCDYLPEAFYQGA